MTKPARTSIAVIFGVAAAGLVHGLFHAQHPFTNVLLAGGAAVAVAVAIGSVVGKDSDNSTKR